MITVQAAINLAPVAKAGSDIEITLPANSVLLNGTGEDSDGFITTYSWLQVSGPAPASISAAGSPATMVNNLVTGDL